MLIRDYAGAEREFCLRWGEVLDLEEACGRRGIGAIYRSLASFEFRAAEVFHTVRLGLRGGGLSEAEARRLVVERFDVMPLASHVALATEILLALMDGAPEARPKPAADPAAPIDKGAVFHAFLQTGITPEQVRAMRFDDVLAFTETAQRTPADLAPSAEEFAAMMAKWESGGFDWARRPAGTA